MPLENQPIINEMNEIFERMHVHLDQRLDQLIRQSKRYSNSMSHSRYKSEVSLVFRAANERKLIDSINNFGQLASSSSTFGIHRMINSTSIPLTMHSMSSSCQQPIKRATVVSKLTKQYTDDSCNTKDDNFRVIGTRGRNKGQFSNPQDVLFAANPNRILFVSDTINQNVQFFSLETGHFIDSISSLTSPKQPSIRRPVGLANSSNSDATIFLTDYDLHTVSSWRIDDTGNASLMKKFGQQTLIGPRGICLSNQSNRIVVVDNKGNKICLFDSSGKLLHTFGTRGNQSHELSGPHYVRFASQNDDRNIIVTDFYNNSVKIFDIERHGQLVSSFGSLGTKNGFFQAPTGLAIDYERGYIFVSDWGNNRIQLFDNQGLFIRNIELSTLNMLYGPQGLDYEPSSHELAIANSGKHCVVLTRID